MSQNEDPWSGLIQDIEGLTSRALVKFAGQLHPLSHTLAAVRLAA